MRIHTSEESSLTSAVTREELHLRTIEMRGFRRSDGMFEVEGRVVDLKPFEFKHPGDGITVAAKHPIHDIGLRLVFDSEMVIREVDTFTVNAPYQACPEGGRALQELKGLRMASGWNREVRSRLSGARSCTHMVELLGPMATTAFQALAMVRLSQPEELNTSGRPVKIDSCYAYSAEGEVVMKRWPQFHRTAQGKP